MAGCFAGIGDGKYKLFNLITTIFMGILSIGKIIHGAVKVATGIAEGDGEEIAKGAKKIISGGIGLIAGSKAVDDDEDA